MGLYPFFAKQFAFIGAAAIISDSILAEIGTTMFFFFGSKFHNGFHQRVSGLSVNVRQH